MKTHRKADGTYAMCRAGKRACPRGGEEVHRDFASKQELVAFNEGVLQEAHGLVATTRRGSEGRERGHEGSSGGRSPGVPSAPQGPPPSPAMSVPRHDLRLLTQEVTSWERVEGPSERLRFMKMALKDAEAQETVEAYAVRDAGGELLAVASLEHREAEEEWGMPKHAVIQHLGSRGRGGAVAITRLLREEAQRRGEELYLEATPSSKDYWERQGVVVDPHGRGVEFYGWPPARSSKTDA